MSSRQMTLYELELLLAKPLERTADQESNIDQIDKYLKGQFRDILESQLCADLFESNLKISQKESLEATLTNCVEQYLEKNSSLSKKLETLCLGLTSLQVFVQVNWTGPSYEPQNLDSDFVLPWLKRWYQPDKELNQEQLTEEISSCLQENDTTVIPVIRNLELLILAKSVLKAKNIDLDSQKWWLFRCLLIHQMVLEDPSPSLHAEIFQLAETLLQYESFNSITRVKALLHLEVARAYLLYSNVVKSEEHISSTMKLLNMKTELIGALGKRTRYQEKEVAQLTIKVTLDKNEEEHSESSSRMLHHLPKDVNLDDAVRLNHISFNDKSVTEVPVMSEIEQAALICLFEHRHKSRPNDKLHVEELMPYLTCLLSQPKVWSLHMSALLSRSRLESNERRTVERSLSQIQTLVDSINSLMPDGIDRLNMIYASFLPSRWRIEADMAGILVSLGAIQSALDIYIRLKMWEEIVACYNLLQLRHKAAEIIKQEMEKKKETVKLWCLLGDSTDDISCYEKAWKLSNEKSSLAQRHWGLYYFYRKKYAESIPHLEKSLSLNSLQVCLWFRLGYAALDQGQWDLCATAYRRYCSLEPESFEAWNNLAKAYIKTGQKARAYRALQEAVKCNYENWKVWDNLMAVSTDCADFEEVIRCYHRILDLNEKHVDTEVLKILTNAILKKIPDNQGNPTNRHRKKALELFGRLTGQVFNNATLWELYARLTASVEQQTAETRVKTVQYLQKALRAAVNGSWEQHLDSCTNVVEICSELADACIAFSRNESSSQAHQMLSSARMSLKSVITKIERAHKDLITGDLAGTVKDLHTALNEKLENIMVETKRFEGI